MTTGETALDGHVDNARTTSQTARAIAAIVDAVTTSVNVLAPPFPSRSLSVGPVTNILPCRSFIADTLEHSGRVYRIIMLCKGGMSMSVDPNAGIENNLVTSPCL